MGGNTYGTVKIILDDNKQRQERRGPRRPRQRKEI